jgi:hypothetical protein
MTRPVGISWLSPARSRIVANKSKVLASCVLALAGAMCPGHQAMAGMRTPPSQV